MLREAGSNVLTNRHLWRLRNEKQNERRNVIMAKKTSKGGDPKASSQGDISKAIKTTTFKNTKLNTVKLNWKEVYYTNCPLVSASNVDQELGWTREEYKKIGVKYAFLRYRP